MTIKNGELADADEVMDAFGSMFNDVAQNIFNAAYIGFDSKLKSTGVPSYDNVSYSIFSSDDADTNYNFLYDSSDDLYICPDFTSITEYVIIEATSLGTWTNGTNNTYVMQVSSGKWLVYCDTGTDAVQRAQIHKSLWYGTDGSNQLILDFTTVTAVKTSNATDVGLQAHYIAYYATNTGAGTHTYTGTFANTSTNTKCSSWTNLEARSSACSSNWEMPSATVLHTVTGSGVDDDVWSYEVGTDLEADEKSNPATCQFEGNETAAGFALGLGFILCVGDITWVDSGSANGTNIDFFTTHSIPLFTEAGALIAEGADESMLIFKDTVTSTDNAVTIINSTIDATSSEQISVSANGGSNWTDVNNGEIARPTAGTALWRRIVITRTDLSKTDNVSEQAVKYNL